MEKFTIGTPVRDVITARNMNEIADTVNRVHGMFDQNSDAFSLPARNDIVRVRTSSNFPKYAAVTLGNLITDPVNSNDPVPTLWAHADYTEDSIVAILQEPANAGEYAKAMISGVSFARLVVNDQDHKYAAPVSSFPGLLSSAVSGPVRILAKSSNSLDGYTVAAVLLGASGSGSDLAYSGPWGIFMYAGYIDVIPGIVWTPGGNMYINPDPIPAPAETSYIILQSPGFLHSVTASITALSDITAGDRQYWNTHALLGLYDAEKAKLIQYHFSPIVFFLETEDFVIEP